MQYFVNIPSEIAFTKHPLKNHVINSLIHWEKLSRGKCFLDFADSSSIWRIRSHDKLIYATTVKTSSVNLLCYLLRTSFISKWVSVLLHYSFLKSIREKWKALKKYANLTHWMPLSKGCETRKHSTKIFYEIIVSKLWENRCDWSANS